MTGVQTCALPIYFDSRWISNEFSRQLVHKWRSEEDAVLVGYNTAWHDNPRLNVRDWVGRNPIRIVIDKNNSLPQTHHLFDESQKTIFVNTLDINQKSNKSVTQNSKLETQNLFDQLNQKNILSVIVEGGANTLNQFIEAGMWDEARVFTSDQTFGSGILAPTLPMRKSVREDVFGDGLDWYLNINF